MNPVFQARFEVTGVNTVTPGVMWELSGTVEDSSYSGWTATDAAAGNLVFDEDQAIYLGTVNCWRVTSIVSAGPGKALTVRVVYNEDGAIGGSGEPAAGSCAICVRSGAQDLSQRPAEGYTQISSTMSNAIRNYDMRKIASYVATAAGVLPVDTDVTAWPTPSSGIVVGNTGRVFLAFKNGTDVYYVELTAI